MAKKPTYEELEQRVKELAAEVVKRKQAEEALRESEERCRVLYEKAPLAYQSLDEHGHFLEVNQAWLDTLGYTRDEVIGKAFGDFLHPDWVDHFKQNFPRFKAVGEILGVEFEMLKKDGSLIMVAFNGKIGRDEKGDFKQTHCILNDITSQKKSDEALRESEERYMSLFKLSFDCVYIHDFEGNFIDANPAALNLLGYKKEEISSLSFGLLLSQDQIPFALKLVEELNTKGFQGNLTEFKLRTKSGEDVFVETESSLVYRDGMPYAIQGIARDVTDRKVAEEALRESEERFRTVADFTYDWEYWCAPDGQFIYISPSCKRITGYSPEEFMNDPGLLEKILHPDDHSMVVSHIRGEQNPEALYPIDFRIITRSGEERWINHNCQPVHDIDGTHRGRRSSNRDISKRKLMQEELLKAKKLESLGVLAGGIAHDFNNLMSAVVGNISLARMEMQPGSKGFKNLVEAEKASIQTKELTSRLITFSKGGGPVKETVSIGDLVKDSVDSSLNGSDIICRFSIPDDISLIEVDEEQMKQVIRNIITNAQEAMAGQGTINVSCENVDIGVKDTLTLKDGKYVKISIEDQGPGIPEEDLIKIFDPYFSTKEMGTQKGMGLGLAVSDSIVKQHDGLITVTSELGTGTIFSIYLPASEREIVEAAPVKKPVSEKLVTQGEKILVMDEEELVRDVCNALLTHIGYKVAVAVEGIEAIEMYQEAMASEKPFDMVILDLTNKIGMGGVETIKRLLEIDPDVRAIVATGYSTDPIISNFREHGFRGALPKPYTLDQLKTTLHNAIAGE